MSQPLSLAQGVSSTRSSKKPFLDASEGGEPPMQEVTAQSADATSSSDAEKRSPEMESLRCASMTQLALLPSPSVDEASSRFASDVVETHPCLKSEAQPGAAGDVEVINPPSLSGETAQLDLGTANAVDGIVQGYGGDNLRELQGRPGKADQQHDTVPVYTDFDISGHGERKSLLPGASFTSELTQGLQGNANRENAAEVFLVDERLDGNFDFNQGRRETPHRDLPGDQCHGNCPELLADNIEATAGSLEAQELSQEHGKGADGPPYIFDFGNDKFLEEITASQDTDEELLELETSNPLVDEMLSPSRAAHVFDQEDGLWEALLKHDQLDAEPAFDEASSVPDGWYGEDGGWNWYTAEERELVRQSMGLAPAVTLSTESRQTTEEFKLSLTQNEIQALSESDARRVPSIQEYSTSATDDEWDTLGRYAAPPRFTDEAKQQVNPYEPRQILANQPILSRAIHPVQDWGSQALPSTATKVTDPTPRASTVVSRGGSSAYDPPILRPQKSFVRPAAFPSAPLAAFPPPPFLPPPPHAALSPPQNQTAPLPSHELPSPLHPKTHRISATPDQQRETHSQTEGYPLGASPQTFRSEPHTKTPERAEESNNASTSCQRHTTDNRLAEPREGSPSYSSLGWPTGQPLEGRRANAWDDRPHVDMVGSSVEEPVLGGRGAVSWSELLDGPSKSFADEAIGADFPHVESVHSVKSTPRAPVGGWLPPSPKRVIRSPTLHSTRQPDILHPVKETLAYEPPALTEELGVGADSLARQGLSARRAPIIAFGFRGVLAMSFPAAETDLSEDASLASSSHGYGYGSPRAQIRLETLDQIVPLSALMLSDAMFPGPLTGEGLTMRPSDKTVKQRRDAVLHYLSERIDELERGLPFLFSGAAGGLQREEFGRLVVLRILKIMLKHNGSMRGSPEIDDELRDAFVLLSSPSILPQPLSPSICFPKLNVEVQNTARILGDVEPLLKLGKRQEALEAAIQHQAWAHALLIASSLGEEQWSRATALFSASLFNDDSVATESLKMTYAIFGSRTEEAVEELCNSYDQRNTPLNQWNQVVGAILEHGKAADQEQLTRLGRCLSSLGMAMAGHACFLVSPDYARHSEGSVMNDFISGDLQIDFDDFVILEEIAEFASSLKHAASKPRDSFGGQKSLWPCKLRRAWVMADRGDVVGAQRYCKALLGNFQSTMPSILVDNLRDLTDRLAGDISANGIGARADQKGLKPGMDKIGSWFEGRITKFIAGDDDATAVDPNTLVNLSSSSATVGPFSHWSAIGHNDDTNNAHPPVNEPVSTGGTRDSIPSTLVAAARLAYMPEVTASTLVSPQGSPPTRYAPVSGGYGPSASSSTAIGYNDEDDLGLGNSSSSTRRRTPGSPQGGVEKVEPEKSQAKLIKLEADTPSNSVTKASWLGRLWGKKEGEATGPVRAKLGEESSMVFDPELKRWIVKGTKPEAVTPSLAPPPRAQTVSPAASSVPRSIVPPQRAAVTNPPSMSSTPAPDIAQAVAPSAPSKRLQSIIQDEALPRNPTNRASQGAGSLDELLTRPPSKRPGSAAAKKNIRNRYVDVLQPNS